MISIAVCDKDRVRTNRIKDVLDDMLSSKGVSYHLFCLSDGNGLMELLADDSSGITIIFLDIGPDDGGGRQLAAEITARYPHIALIDSSNAGQGADRAREQLLRSTVARVLERALNQTPREEADKARVLTVMAKGAVHNFMIDAIEYIMSDRRIVIIHENGAETAIYAKLDDIEEKIGPGFVRCHQSYLVNMSRIKTFDNKKIRLFSDTVIPISQKRRIQAREKYFRYLGGTMNK
ncbi:two component transcriptional regulator, LytTR family [Sporobacter termitidis DSM 10068]|uniref:Two component transcriptional regulator, LytTR family n=1 Tax=Sporobacter termitidis DSM 10068 TaxID=1123282 RepID=A0A1M5WFL5_9FIRM|nr:LytTR family DNA-binding domain-containing protein [Sporobacter termitidis]SHH86291.1 two component transcriptional regulator, LytTR family [Sporobacter termitidis DSM 10068]